MCRLFAQLSATPTSARDLLVDSEFSLLKQANFKKGNLQKDGWGIGHWNKDGAVVSKSPNPVYKEETQFVKAAAAARSNVVIAHLRAASNPRGIPRGQLITMQNAQPFTDGRWIFVHNGTLEIPEEVAGELGPLAKNVKALNDSEVYFWQWVKHYRRLKDGARAFQASVTESWSLWAKCRKKHGGKATPYTSLNAIVSDGKKLYAFCHAVRRGLAACGVCNPDQPWSLMSFAERNGRLIVASENLDRGSWTPFNPPEVLEASVRAGRVSIRRKLLEPAPRGLNFAAAEALPA